jgi:hypothetical protein
MTQFDKQTQLELDAEVLQKLLNHLEKRSDVQNIDLMNLAGFCRNCLSRWYAEAASDKGLEISKVEARSYIYRMPYAEWKERYQTEASPEQQEALSKVMADPDLTS